jgi:O-antigen ligase
MKAIQYNIDPNWLFVFIAFYPFILFPGGLFFYPTFLDESTYQAAVENFLLLPKIFFLIAFSLLGLLVVRSPEKRSPFVVIVFLHLFLVITSALNAEDEIAFTILGPQWRLDGVIYHVFLSLLMLATFLTAKNRHSIFEKIIFILMGGALFLVIIFIFQILGFDLINPLILNVGKPLSDLAGTMSLPGYLAGWLLPICILAIFQVAKLSNFKHFSVIIITVSILITTGLFYTGNRAAIYSLIFIQAVSLVFLRSKRLLFASTGVIFIAFLISSIPIGKVYSASIVNTRTLETRLVIWRLAYESIQKIRFAPWIGSGSDAFRLGVLRDPPVDIYIGLLAKELNWKNFEIESAKVIVPENKIRLSELSIVFKKINGEKNKKVNYLIELDKAHNFFLDRLLAFGIFDVVIWIVLFAYPIFFGMKNFRTESLFLISMALLGTSIYYMVWFSVIQVEPMHLVLVSIAWGIIYQYKKQAFL